MSFLTIVEFNVLAPIWVNEKLYPNCPDLYFDSNRLQHKMNYIQEYLSDADIYALTETQSDENDYLAELFVDYDYYAAYHEPDYWMEWRSSATFKRNGVAIAINLKVFSVLDAKEVPLYIHGNRCLVATCKHLATQRLYRFSVIHLNPNEDKFAEVGSLIDYLEENRRVYIDIIVGDFNSNIRTLNVLKNANFADTFKQLAIERSTIALTRNVAFGSIDHIIYRDETKSIEPYDGITHDMNVWMLASPHQNRLCETVERNGSDHFAIACVFRVT